MTKLSKHYKVKENRADKKMVISFSSTLFFSNTDCNLVLASTVETVFVLKSFTLHFPLVKMPGMLLITKRTDTLMSNWTQLKHKKSNHIA